MGRLSRWALNAIEAKGNSTHTGKGAVKSRVRVDDAGLEDWSDASISQRMLAASASGRGKECILP